MPRILLSAAALLMLMMFTGCEQNLQQPDYRFTLQNPADSGSRFPHLYRDDEGVVYMSWISNIDESINVLRYSTFSDSLWTAPQTIRIDTDFFVNWADFPSVIGSGGEVLASHWLEDDPRGRVAYNINVSFPSGDGSPWAEPVRLHRDTTATEHGFVSMEPVGEDRILAIWLDGRETAGRADDAYSDTSMSMTLRSAEINSEGEIFRPQVIDATVCDCCQTDIVQSGNDYIAVYRGRTADEVRDIKITRYSPETGEWTAPETLYDDGWQVAGCPVNGPAITADGETVAVAWFTAADGESAIKLIISEDGGATFNDPIIVAGPDSEPLGRTDVVIGPDRSIYTSWLQKGEEENAYVVARKLDSDGNFFEGRVVGITSASSSSGFPQMEITGNSLILAWTQTDPLLRVRTALVDLEALEPEQPES